MPTKSEYKVIKKSRSKVKYPYNKDVLGFCTANWLERFLLKFCELRTTEDDDHYQEYKVLFRNTYLGYSYFKNIAKLSNELWSRKFYDEVMEDSCQVKQNTNV